MADLPTPRWPTAGTAERAVSPAPAGRSGPDGDEGAADRVSRLAAVALLLVAMLIWLFTALLFAHHGYYAHHQYPASPWQDSWQQRP